jgi:MFS family permease
VGRLSTLVGEVRFEAFRKLWLSQVVSEVGDWAARLALTTLIYERTGSATWAALMAVSSLLPMLGPGQMLASLADGMDRRVILVAADAIRAGIFVLIAATHLPTAALLILSIGSGVATVPFEAARSAAILDVTPAERLPAAMALGQATQSLALVVGWAAGGLLLALIGTSGALAVNAASFVVSASFLIRLPLLRAHVEADADEPSALSTLGRLKAAAATLLGDSLIRRSAAVAVFAVGPATAVETLVVPYVDHTWSATPSLAAVVLASGAALDLVLTVVISTNQAPEQLVRIAAWCAAAPAAVAMVLFSTGVAALGAAGFVVSAMSLTAIAPASAALAPRLPSTLRASSFTVLATMLTLTQVVLSTSGGALADSAGSPAAASLLLVLPLTVGAAALLRPLRRPAVALPDPAAALADAA